MKFSDIKNSATESTVYKSGNENLMYLMCNQDKNSFDELISDIRANGYSDAQSSEIDYFHSFTFEKDNCFIVANYDEKATEIRLFEDSFSERLNVAEKRAGKCPVRMWQFEVDHTLIDCGMCYIFQCTDYSFIIIDSAHFYSLNDDQRLYDFLRKETPSGMPVVISGWYLSHGHADHICKCLDFILYKPDVKVKGLYYNFVPNDHFSADNWLVADIKHTELFNREIEKRTDIPKYKLHAGQYFYIDCIRFDILCCHEDVFPQSMEDYNNSSLMAMVTVDGDKISFPGDASAKSSVIAERRFPDFLKCDIVQVAHHGHHGTSVDFYKRSDARVALFPVTQIKFDEEYPRIEANRVACEIAKHVYIASNGTVMFTLPLKDSKILIYPDETNESFEGVFNLWSYDYTEEFKQKHIENFRNSNKFKEELY